MEEIYKFSLEGILPSELAKKRKTCMLILFVVAMCSICCVYILMCTFFSLNHEIIKLGMLSKI